jgi:ribosomal protein L13E
MKAYTVVHRPRKSRKGRGFSRSELKEVGLNLKQALKMGIQIDPKRSTKHDENVKAIMTYLVAEEASIVDMLIKKNAITLAKDTAQIISSNKLAKANSEKETKKIEISNKRSQKRAKDLKSLDKKTLKKKTKREQLLPASAKNSGSSKKRKR